MGPPQEKRGTALRGSPKDRDDSLFQAVDDQRTVVARHAFVDAAKGWRVVIRSHAAEAGYDRDVLLAVDGIADNAALMACAVAMIPQLGARLGIVGMNRAARVRHEHQIASGRQHTSQRGLGEADFPLLLACDRITRIEVTINLAARRRRDLEVRADVKLGLRSDD